MQIIKQTPTSRAYRKGNRLYLSKADQGVFRRFAFEPNQTKDLETELKDLSEDSFETTVETVLSLAQRLNANTYYQVAM